jgi:hypothetical protein
MKYSKIGVEEVVKYSIHIIAIKYIVPGLVT